MLTWDEAAWCDIALRTLAGWGITAHDVDAETLAAQMLLLRAKYGAPGVGLRDPSASRRRLTT